MLFDNKCLIFYLKLLTIIISWCQNDCSVYTHHVSNFQYQQPQMVHQCNFEEEALKAVSGGKPSNMLYDILRCKHLVLRLFSVLSKVISHIECHRAEALSPFRMSISSRKFCNYY